MESLKKHYKVTTDWEGRNYCGLTLNWNYDEGYVDVAMPKYFPDSVKRLQHVPKKYPQYSLHEHVPIQYAKKGTQQYTMKPDESPQLDPVEKNMCNPPQGLSSITEEQWTIPFSRLSTTL